MNLIYLKSALKCDSFDVAIGLKIPFFRVLVTIEPGCSLLQLVTMNCFKGVQQGAILSPVLYNNSVLDSQNLMKMSSIFCRINISLLNCVDEI